MLRVGGDGRYCLGRRLERQSVDRRLVLESDVGDLGRQREGRDYLSLKLDDPSFSDPIFANLFDDEGAETATLIWSRPRRAAND